MTRPLLVLGNRNYSSWSLRPWLLMRHAGIAFDELCIPLYLPDSKARILRHSPSGKVPALRDGAVTVWDSLAICEYVAEKHPERQLWPADPAARAAARSVSAEMHSGFAALRSALPMNLRRAPAPVEPPPEAAADIGRILELWDDCRRRFGARGPFLFGAFSIADAMYAPVACRFHAYCVPLPPSAQAYAETLLGLPAMQEWTAAARAEAEVIEKFER